MTDNLSLTLAALAMLGAALLSGCANRNATPAAESPNPLFEFADARAQQQPLSARGKQMLAVMAAEYAAQAGDAQTAAVRYLDAAEATGQVDVAREAVRYALTAGDTALAMRAVERWVAADPADTKAVQAAFRIALEADDMAAAKRYVEAMVRTHPEGPSAGLIRLAALISGGEVDPKDAVELTSVATASFGDLREAPYVRGIALLADEQNEAAQQAAEAALALEPDWERAMVLRAEALVQQGQVLTAIASLREPLTQPDSVELRFELARMLLRAEAYAPARAQLKAVLAERPTHVEATFAYGLIALDDGEYDIAQTQFERLRAHPTLQHNAHYYLGRIAEKREDTATALAEYAQVRAGSHLIESFARRARLLSESEGMDAARALLVRTRDRYPQLASQMIAIEAELLTEAGQGDAAVQLYGQALEAQPGEPELLYGRSLAYEQAGRHTDAEADLRTILADAPDDARALNALGYVITNHPGSKRAKRLREALTLIERANALAPGDAAIMDSLGWVHYRLGNLEVAELWLRKAFAKGPDPEIAAHLGEVLWVTGREEDARTVWQAAAELTPDHDVLSETVQRLTQ